MSDSTTKHYIINYSDITNIPFVDIDTEKLQVINNKLTTIYADTNLRAGKNINISTDGYINVTNTFINDTDINKIYYNGNVGIGTTDPESLLNIYDSINNSNLLNINNSGLTLDTNINISKTTIQIGSDLNKINKIHCNFINDIDTTFLTEDNLKNNIFYTRTDINGITSGITNTINLKSTEDRGYTTEVFTNSSNYTNNEITKVTTELQTYSDTQNLSTLNNSSNYSEELFENSSNYSHELFSNSSNYSEELSTNTSNYISNEISRVGGDVISNAFNTNIRSELPELVITEEITSLRSETKSVANIVGNYNDASGIILTANNSDNYKSFIILKSVNSSSSVKIYNYDDDNLLISTNNNDISSPTIILNNRKMIIGYDTSEYFASPSTDLYNSTNTLEIKGNININGNLKKNNETINLNIWSTQSNNVNYIGDIIFKDNSTLTNTAYTNGSLVTVSGNLSENKQGLIIEKSDRTQRIGITDSSIQQLGGAINANLSIKSKGSQPVTIGNNTTDILYVYSDKIGIGTSSPDQKLTVYDGRLLIHQNSTSDNAVLHLLSNTYNTYLFGDKTNGSFYIRTHDNKDFIIDSNGSVGIGIFPQTKLHVQMSNNTYLRVETDTNAISQTSGIEFGIPTFSSNIRSKITSTTHSGDASDLRFYTNTSSSTEAQTRMIINQNGNIGINHSSPIYKLDVDGTMRLGRNDIDNSHGKLIFGKKSSSTSSRQAILGYTDNYEFSIADGLDTNNGQLKIAYQAPTNTIYCHSNANVGIGNNTSPAYKLDINGNARCMNSLNIEGTGDVILRLKADTNNNSGGEGDNPMIEFRQDNNLLTGLIGTGNLPTGGGSNDNAMYLQHCGGTGIVFLSGPDQNVQNTSLERMRILTNGNIGINKTNPSEKLHVNGNQMISGIQYVNGGSLYAKDNNNLQIGALNIGSTDKNYGGGNNWNSNTAGLLLECADNTEIAVHDQGTRVSSLMYFQGSSANSITIGRDMGWGTISKIILNGNIGIGTSSPSSKLHISDGSSYFKLYGNSAGDFEAPALAPHINTGDFTVYTGNVGSGSALFKIKNSGNVGIGTTTPGYKLDVNGSFNCSSLTIGGNDINSVINIGTNIFEGTGTKVSIGTSAKYQDSILSLNVGDEGTMLSSPHTSQFLWRINSLDKWGIYWSTNTSGNNYTMTTDSNPNEIIFVGNNASRASVDLDNGAFYSKEWFRTIGNGGWRSETHGGGWYMQDSTWIRSYGSKQVFINSLLACDGRMGVGTSSPGYKLDVIDSVSGTGYIATFRHTNLTQGIGIQYDGLTAMGSNTNQDIRIKSKNSGKVIFNTNSNDHAVFDGSGNLGVGTTGPSEKLDVVGNIKLSGNILKGSTNYIQDYFNNNALSITGRNDTLNTNNTAVGVHIAKYSTNHGYIDIRSSDDSGGWIDFNKNENSDYKTRIRGFNNPIKLVFYVDGTTERVTIESTKTTISNLLDCTSGIQSTQILVKRASPLFEIDGINNTNPVINMRTNSSSSSGYKLLVNYSDDSFSFVKNISGGVNSVFTVASSKNVTFAENVTVNKILTVSSNLSVTGTGNISNTVTIGTSNTDTTERLEVKGKARIRHELLCDNDIVAYASDERLKKKLNSLSNVLENLENIDVFRYENTEIANKYFKNKLQIGLSAQEINKYYPEVVALAPFDSEYDENEDKYISKSGENYLTLKYERLVAVSLQGIKELHKKNKDLETKIENLENKNLKLENELEKIKKYLNIK